MVKLTQDYYDESTNLGTFATIEEAKVVAEEKANLRSPEWLDYGNGYITTEYGLEGYLTIRPVTEET